jgi:hypothetical protein
VRALSRQARRSVMQTTIVSTSSLTPNPRNARTHSKRQIGQIAESISQFGFVVPIVADENKVILAGHGRYQAAQSLGLAAVPTTDTSVMRDGELMAHFYGVWRLVDKRADGRFYKIVKPAVIDACEMRELARDISQKKNRAAVGRSRLIEALPDVAEEVRLLDLADAI